MGKKKGELPSGNVRVQVYDYTDEYGKKHYRSFTARTRTEAKAMAAEWRFTKAQKPLKVTVLDVIEEYTVINESRLSPTTYKTYHGYLKYFKKHQIGQILISDLTNTDVQRFVNDLREKVGPKTVKNVYLLLKPAVELKRDDFHFKVVLPQLEKNEKHIPTEEEVRRVIEACNCPEMVLAIKLSLFGMMRRGEVCALTYKDIDFASGKIKVNKSYALTDDNLWVLKTTKTRSSVRDVTVPKEILSELKKYGHRSGPMLGLMPSWLSNRFVKTVRRSGVEAFTFHALRHFAQSQASAANIPPVYIEQMGGWERGSDVRTKTYDHVIDLEQVRFSKIFVQKISGILDGEKMVSHEVSHG